MNYFVESRFFALHIMQPSLQQKNVTFRFNRIFIVYGIVFIINVVSRLVCAAYQNFSNYF